MASSRAHFLNLPGELRNHIYRLCLVGDPISINSSTTFPEPPLLAVCKDVRAEASTIFYGENQFEVQIHDHFDSAPLMVILTKVPIFKRLGRLPIPLKTIFIRQPNWHNLEEWLRRRHATEVGVLPGPNLNLSHPPDDAEWHLIRAMHFMAHNLHDLPWARVQSLLEPFWRTLVAIDRRWARDADI